MMNRKNKKAQFFAAAIVLVTILLIGRTWHCFIIANRKIDTSVNALEEFTDIYNEEDRLVFYVKESAKLAASQALYIIAKDAAIDKDNLLCSSYIYNDKEITKWNQDCKPEKWFIEEKFFYEYNKTFTELIQSYPKEIDIDFEHILEDETIKTIIKKTFSASKKTDYADYNLSYDLSDSVEIALEEQGIDLNFKGIYEEIGSVIKECKEESQETQEIKKCIEKTEFEHWDFAIEKINNVAVFAFKTKEHFFFEKDDKENFEVIELYFEKVL